MGILTWIVLGLVAGALAKLFLPGRDPGGFFVTILIGIAGAILGGYVSSLAGLGTVTGLNIPSVLIAAAGSVILLLVYRVVRRRR